MIGQILVSGETNKSERAGLCESQSGIYYVSHSHGSE